MHDGFSSSHFNLRVLQFPALEFTRASQGRENRLASNAPCTNLGLTGTSFLRTGDEGLILLFDGHVGACMCELLRDDPRTCKAFPGGSDGPHKQYTAPPPVWPPFDAHSASSHLFAATFTSSVYSMVSNYMGWQCNTTTGANKLCHYLIRSTHISHLSYLADIDIMKHRDFPVKHYKR